MGRILTTRRSEWLPGLAVLAAAVGIGALAGVANWPIYLGLVAMALVAGALVRHLRAKRVDSSTARGKLKVIQGGKAGHYDLARDRSTDNQRWLM